MAGLLRSLACATVAGCLLGCQLVLGFEELQPGSTTAGTGNQGGSEAGATQQDPCAELAAPATGGAPMLKLARGDRSCFFMDEHEVTSGDYEQFALIEHERQSGECSWNDQYVDEECRQASTRISPQDDHPVVCVDQCDAQAFCEWAGKELCRGDVTFPDDEARDDWHSACTNQGETKLPYGATSDEDVCNVQEAGEATTWAIDVGTACENTAGVRDLVGNVWEWVGGADGCKRSSNAGDECLARGSSFADQNRNCDNLLQPTRGTTEDNLGFRCCAYVE